MAYFTDEFNGKKYFEKIEFDHLEFFLVIKAICLLL